LAPGKDRATLGAEVPMTEAGWERCVDPRPMLAQLKGKVSGRKLRLWCVAVFDANRQGYPPSKAIDAWRRGGPHDSEGPSDVEGVAMAIVHGTHDREGDPPMAVRAALIRDIFGNPFRPVHFDDTWRTPDVVTLATAAYEQRTLPGGELDPHRLAVLADALEEVGAAGEVVAHLRSEGPHVRGCWAVDLILGLG
jgi:hypothetical protein